MGQWAREVQRASWLFCHVVVVAVVVAAAVVVVVDVPVLVFVDALVPLMPSFRYGTRLADEAPPGQLTQPKTRRK